MATEQQTPVLAPPSADGHQNGSSTRRSRKKKGGMPKWGIALIIVAIAGIGVFAWMKTHTNTDPTKDMILVPVSRGSIVETVTATGSVTAQTGAEVQIGSQITGIIKRLYADVGTHLKAGQLIAQLDLPDLKDQVDESQAALVNAKYKLDQTITGVAMTDTQLQQAEATAKAGVTAAVAKLDDAKATADQQVHQTPTDIRKAITGLAAAKAALTTAKATLVQTQDGADLNVATARDQLNTALANQKNSAVTLTRNKDLLSKGFVAQGVVDQAQATADVNDAAVASGKENLTLTQQKVTADLQTAKDAVDQAVQGVKTAQAQYDSAIAERYLDKARMADVVNARAAQLQSQQAVTVAIANLAQIEQQQQLVAQAKASVDQAQATVLYNQVQLDKSSIRTPISGTVIQLAEQQGDTVAAGLAAPTLIVVADLNRLQVDAFVDETDIAAVKLGEHADITIDAFPKHIFDGVVAKIASGSTIQNGVVTYDVTLAIKQDKKHVLRPDMTASVSIKTGERDNVLTVPSVAIQLGTRGATVNVVDRKDGQVNIVRTKIQTGGSDGVNTEVRSGLTEGQTIVEAGASAGGGGPRPNNPFGSQQQKGGGGGGGRGRGGM